MNAEVKRIMDAVAARRPSRRNFEGSWEDMTPSLSYGCHVLRIPGDGQPQLHYSRAGWVLKFGSEKFETVLGVMELENAKRIVESLVLGGHIDAWRQSVEEALK